MTPLSWMLWLALLAAAIIDTRTRKIPNKLTFAVIVLGFLGNSLLPNGIGLQASALGFGAAFALHYTLAALGLEGAGDGKLMIGVGTCLGWQLMIEATLWRYVLLVPYAVVAITVLGRWPQFKKAVLWTVFKVTGQPVGERPEPTKLPFGPIVAVSVPLAQATVVLNKVLGF